MVDINLIPEGNDSSPACGGPVIGLSLDGTRRADVESYLQAAIESGFAGIEIAATGEPMGIHAPAVTPDERERFRFLLHGGNGEAESTRRFAVLAPTQNTFDLTLVSPSAVIRRASVTEIWSVCRFAGSLRRDASGFPATVVVRTGVAPFGADPPREAAALSECLTTLDRMAGEQGAEIAVLNADFFRDLSRLPVLRTLNLPHTGIALDIRAALDYGATIDNLITFVRENDDLLRYVRVPDNFDRAMPADKIGAFAEALLASGYDGMVCIVPTAAAGEMGKEVGRACDAWQSALTFSKPDAGSRDSDR